MNNTIEHGSIFTSQLSVETETVPWNKHATCPGVYLKHLVKGSQTDGKFSCHLVKVEAGCVISEHIHADNWETHEIIAGNAVGYLEKTEIAYTPGTMAVIPAGRQHRVKAGSEDLIIRATFVPALV